jgi:hypothetical protein
MKEPQEMRPGNRYARPAKKARTLQDLAMAKLALVAVCQRCRHRKLLFPLDLAERLGASFPVDQVPPRLRCTECRALGWVALHDSVRD